MNMNFKNFSKLYVTDFNLSKMLVMNQQWQTNPWFIRKKPRATNALLLFVGCDGCYENDNETITIPCKSIFFIPAGSTYKWTFSNFRNQSVSTILFEFLLSDSNGNPINIEEAQIIPISDFKFAQDLFTILVSEFSKPRLSMSKIKSTAYSLIGTITEEGQKNFILNDRFSCIYPGIKYLENDSLQEKTIAEIAEMCCVSVNYFDRLFKEYAGMTPARYRLQKKISRACRMLRSGMFNVQQVATETGFSDYAYFCRIFKKLCGCTPTEYKNSIKKS